MLLFWRKNRLKVKSIRILKENEKPYKYLPISVLLETLNSLSEEYPKLFRYEVKLYTDCTPGYAEGASILLYYKDKELFNDIVNMLVIDYCGRYNFTFNCDRWGWEVL